MPYDLFQQLHATSAAPEETHHSSSPDPNRVSNVSSSALGRWQNTSRTPTIHIDGIFNSNQSCTPSPKRSFSNNSLNNHHELLLSPQVSLTTPGNNSSYNRLRLPAQSIISNTLSYNLWNGHLVSDYPVLEPIEMEEDELPSYSTAVASNRVAIVRTTGRGLSKKENIIYPKEILPFGDDYHYYANNTPEILILNDDFNTSQHSTIPFDTSINSTKPKSLENIPTGSRPWIYPRNHLCVKCNNTGIKRKNGLFCLECWRKFSKNSPYVSVITKFPPAPPVDLLTFDNNNDYEERQKPKKGKKTKNNESTSSSRNVSSSLGYGPEIGKSARIFKAGDLCLSDYLCGACRGSGFQTDFFATTDCEVCAGIGRVDIKIPGYGLPDYTSQAQMYSF